MHRAEPVVEKLGHYFLIIKRSGGHRSRPRRWAWEIRRRKEPFGVKYSGDKFVTAQDAKLAGEKALKELLHT